MSHEEQDKQELLTLWHEQGFDATFPLEPLLETWRGFHTHVFMLARNFLIMQVYLHYYTLLNWATFQVSLSSSDRVARSNAIEHRSMTILEKMFNVPISSLHDILLLLQVMRDLFQVTLCTTASDAEGWSGLYLTCLLQMLELVGLLPPSEASKEHTILTQLPASQESQQKLNPHFFNRWLQLGLSERKFPVTSFEIDATNDVTRPDRQQEPYRWEFNTCSEEVEYRRRQNKEDEEGEDSDLCR